MKNNFHGKIISIKKKFKIIIYDESNKIKNEYEILINNNN